MRFGRRDDATEETLPVDVGLVWDTGAPSPTLLQSEYRTFLAFYLRTEADSEAVGVIEWIRCGGAVLGGLNDEAMAGHPAWGRGIAGHFLYESVVIGGSRWIAEWELANRVHPYHDADEFSELRHFLLAFHDSTFECVAAGFRSYAPNQPMAEVLTSLSAIIVGDEPVPYPEVKADPGPQVVRPWER